MNRSFVVVALVLVSAVGCSHASVALHPLTNRVYWTRDDKLEVCDQALANCQEHRLSMKPEGAFVDSTGRLLFVEGSQLYRCDESGGACQQFALPFSGAAGVAAASSGQVVVVSSGGGVALCDESKCAAAPKKQ